MLCHRRLGYIPIDIMKKLVNEGVLSTLDFAYFDTGKKLRSNAKFPQFLWTEALNRVPTKDVPKTHFELFKRWKPSLQHICVWGCLLEVKICNPLS